MNIMVVGAGKIGSLIACLLCQSEDYEVYLADIDFSGSDVARLLKTRPSIKKIVLDVKDQNAMVAYVKENQITTLISSLPFFLNIGVAQVARQADCHYFDLTEDVNVTTAVKKIAKGAKKAFLPQCGVAPGMINIIANSLIQSLDRCEKACLRVGALPQRTHNTFHYSLTWSTDGLINEYANECQGIEGGKLVSLEPLVDLETIHLDGETYEAFNTSGGLGSLTTLYQNKINILNYKTIRYAGHCEKIRFLMQDLNFNQDRAGLKAILERVIPKTYQDLVILYVSVEGYENGILSERSYLKKIFPEEIAGLHWSAIQIATAAGVVAVVDLVLSDENQYHGFVFQERFRLEDILSNRFGQIFQGSQ